MVNLLYSIPTWLLGVLIVGLSAALSALGLLVVHRIVPVEERRSQNDVTGYISNIAAFVYAVVLAFIAVAVWQQYGQAQTTVQLEANAASDIFHQADGYPEPFRQRVEAPTRDRLRPPLETFTALEQRPYLRMGLQFLEEVVRRQRGIAVVESHDHADRQHVVAHRIDERTAELAVLRARS